MQHLRLGTLVLLVLFFSQTLQAVSLFPIERRSKGRRAQEAFGYLVYPVVGRLPGVGVAYGGIGAVQNTFDSKTDFSFIGITGDVSALVANVSQIELLEDTFFLDGSLFTTRLPVRVYDRGMSGRSDGYYRPEVRETGGSAQFKAHFWERRLTMFARLGSSETQITRVFDQYDNEFAVADNAGKGTLYSRLGAVLDWTDDFVDPRQGLRLEVVRTEARIDDPTLSDFFTMHYSGTLYIPVGDYSTWAFNVYRSHSQVTTHRNLSASELDSRIGLKCEAVTDPVKQQSCAATEARRVRERMGTNANGNAGYLGGSERLRSYPVNRFRASEAIYGSTELRWNLTDEARAFDLGFIKGVSSNIQLAFFYEIGAESDPPQTVESAGYADSYGIGIRMLFSGAVLRLDFGQGREGSEYTLFFGYPWNIPVL